MRATLEWLAAREALASHIKYFGAHAPRGLRLLGTSPSFATGSPERVKGPEAFARLSDADPPVAALRLEDCEQNENKLSCPNCHFPMIRPCQPTSII